MATAGAKMEKCSEFHPQEPPHTIWLPWRRGARSFCVPALDLWRRRRRVISKRLEPIIQWRFIISQKKGGFQPHCCEDLEPRANGKLQKSSARVKVQIEATLKTRISRG